MPTLYENRKEFLEGLMPLVFDFISPKTSNPLTKLFSNFQRTQAQLQASMALKTTWTNYHDVFLRNKLGEPKDDELIQLWVKLISLLREFYQTVKGSDKGKEIETYIAQSPYPNILTDPILFVPENILPMIQSNFEGMKKCDENKFKPATPILLLGDIERYQHQMTISIDKKTHQLNDWFTLAIEDTNEPFVVTNMSNQEVQRFEKPEEALNAIKAIFKVHFKNQDTFEYLVSFLHQTVLLGPMKLDIRGMIGYVGAELLRGNTDVQPLKGEELEKNYAERNQNFQPQDPQTTYEILDDHGPVISVQYHYHRYKLIDSDPNRSISMLTPVTVEERYRCTLSSDGQTATIKHEPLNFREAEDFELPEPKVPHRLEI